MARGRKWTFSNIMAAVPSYRNRVIIILIGMVLGLVSLTFTSDMARKLRQKENNEIQLWAGIMQQYGPENYDNRLLNGIIDGGGNSVPFVLVNENYYVLFHNSLIPDEVLHDEGKLEKLMAKFLRQNDPIAVRDKKGNIYHILYGNSRLQRSLEIFPFIQITVIVVFVIFGYITFRTSEEDEQNKVWIGLAKETAHQLGTPISSLLGWAEYLRSQDIDPEVVTEMEKDLTRLMKVADRFSKIGSETTLHTVNINELVGGSVMYFRTRVPKNVELDYNGLAIAPILAYANPALFEWVTENLLKNSLDALQGQGRMEVRLAADEDWVNIDFIDTGKGMPKANFKRIFDPGFTTKTRGWGLGLSLSRRIIEEYHKGKIYVVGSEVGKGTTIRVTLRRSYDEVGLPEEQPKKFLPLKR